MWSGAGALPMSCPLLERDGLLSMEMLDIAERDPVPPAASVSAFPIPEPKEEEQILEVPEEPWTSKPEEAVHSEGGLDLIRGRLPAIPPGFAHSQVNQTQAGLAMGIPLGAQLDFSSLGSLQVTISHYLAVKEVWYDYQSWVITQESL